MRFEWEKVQLGSLCSISSSKRIFAREYQTSGIPFYRGKEIIEKHKGNIVSTELYISRERYEEIKKKFDVPQVGDILLTSVGTIGTPWLVNEADFYFKDGNLTWLRCKDTVLNKWLYLWLNSAEAKNQIDAKCIGSTQKALTIETLNKFTVTLPTLDIQEKICSIMYPIMEKIEINNRINKNLEEQASAIFKAWFVDYLPFDETVPSGWENVTLDSITVLVSRGITPKYADDSNQIVINQKCIRNHMVSLSEARKHTPKAINEKWLRFGDLLINSTGTGTLGRTAQVWFEPENLTVDSHITIVRPAFDYLTYYIGFWGLQHEAEIESLHTGSTGQTELPRDRVKAITLPLPDRDTLLQFNQLIQPMTAAIVSNQSENVRLATLRDALLPKLMSGELDVSNLDL